MTSMKANTRTSFNSVRNIAEADCDAFLRFVLLEIGLLSSCLLDSLEVDGMVVVLNLVVVVLKLMVVVLNLVVVVLKLVVVVFS